MGVDIPGKKHIRFALRYIHGSGCGVGVGNKFRSATLTSKNI